MGEKKTTPITINDKEYVLEDMSLEQQLLVQHCNDLGRKIDSTKFNLDQLTVGKDAFVNMLVQKLENPEPEVEEAKDEPASAVVTEEAAVEFDNVDMVFELGVDDDAGESSLEEFDAEETKKTETARKNDEKILK